MRILVSNEFYELFRGDKDLIIPRLLAKGGRHQVYILCPSQLSPSDKQAGFTYSKLIFEDRLGLGPEAVQGYSSRVWVRKTHNKQVPFVLPSPSYLFHLWRIRPDIIVESIYTTLTPRSFLNWIYCALFRKSRILLDAGDEGHNRWRLPFERQAIQSARKIFTYSQGGVDRIVRKYGIKEPDKFFIHLKLLEPGRFRYLEPFTRKDFTVGYVGRFLHAKGFGRFLELAQHSAAPAVRFRAVGLNVDHFDIPESVELTDYVENERLAEIYSSIDLLVLPDMRKFQGYSTVAQEALMCGARVALGSLDQSFYPKKEGVFFFDPDHPEDLIRFIARQAQVPIQHRMAARHALAEDYRNAADGSGFLAEMDKLLNGDS